MKLFQRHGTIEPMKSRLRELQVVVDRADTFAKWAMTSRQARDGFNTHVGICIQNIDKLKWVLGQHTAKNCWAAGSNLMFKEATLRHADRIEKSLAALGLNCNIALESVKRCNVYDKRDS